MRATKGVTYKRRPQKHGAGWGKANDQGGSPPIDPEMVVNGDFTTDLSGWDVFQWTWLSGRAKPLHVSSNSIQQDIGMVDGTSYDLSFHYTLESGAALYVKFGNPAGINTIVLNGPIAGVHVETLNANGSTIFFSITGAATLDDWIDKVSVKEAP